MKRTYLLGLLLALVPFLGVAPTARTVEPLNALSDTDATELAPLDSVVVGEPVEPRDGAFSGLSALSTPDRPRSASDEPLYSWRDAARWYTLTVDAAPGVGQYASLALDVTDHPHISYHDKVNGTLKRAWHDGITWHTQVITTGRAGALALDRTGQAHLAYFGPPYILGYSSSVNYARHDGAAWHFERTGALNRNRTSLSLAVDSANHPHIATCRPWSGIRSNPCPGIQYIAHNGTVWEIQVVDSMNEGGPAYAGLYNSLALDRDDRPHIGYIGYHRTTTTTLPVHLKYTWYDGTVWQIEAAVEVPFAFGPTSLALDSAQRPHIAYVAALDQYSDPRLRYAWRDGTVWYSTTVDSLVEVDFVSLAVDVLDHPHIAYYDVTHGDLRYARYDGRVWYTETVDSTGDMGQYVSLALGRDGSPHISYYDATGQHLRYAHLPAPPLSLTQHTTPTTSLHPRDLFTYTLILYGPGLNVRLWDPLPASATYALGSLTGTVTPTAVYSPTAHAVIWQGTLPTDTVQTVHFQVTPNVAGMGLSPVPIVNTAWLTATESGRVVSATTSVNVLPPPFYLRKQATPEDGLRNNDTLTYTLTISGPGLNVRLWDPLPPSVRYVSGSITDTIGSISGTVALPAAVYSPTAHAVLWEGTLPTDTVEVIRFQVTPGITGTGSLSLSLPIVNTAWLTATESGWSVSATVIVNGLHLYLPLMLRDN